MRKYLLFAKTAFLQQLHKLSDNIGTFMSFTIHVLVFNELWHFILNEKDIAGYTRQNLIWYIIIGEVMSYSFHNYYRTIVEKVKNSDIAYDMSKPYNFMGRIVVEGLGTFPKTLVILIIGIVLGFILAGPIALGIIPCFCILLCLIISLVLNLLIHMIIGLSTIWLGSDVSSLWLLVSKTMLIFVFTPLELFPKAVQNVLVFLPTTHVVYTPSKLLVHFSYELFLKSALVYQSYALIVLLAICFVLYKKGVKNLNVYGI